MDAHRGASTDASAAPTSPPIRAWLELEGIVKYQVIRFQVMAPTNAASTTKRPLMPAVADVGTIPFAIVVATAIERNAPRKLSDAEMRTATIGLRARWRSMSPSRWRYRESRS